MANTSELGANQILPAVDYDNQGSRCLLEICVNRRETLRILRQWHEKCVQHNLKLTHIQSQN